MLTALLLLAAATTAEAETRAAIERVERLNPMLNAVIAVDPTALEQARALDHKRRSRGPLHGVPVLIKDNVETAGPLPTTAGSLALAANVTGRDAPVVARLRKAGAVILGKANLSEWANFRDETSISGWSAVGGQTRNPYALDRNPCGSSSGSAVAVASGMVRMAIGTETNGSIACPASATGIVGLKPTVGLVSRHRILPISASLDTAGPMAATVREAAQLLTVIAGSDPADPATREADKRRTDYAKALDPNAPRGTRLGVMRFATGFGTGPAFEAALKTLAAQGAVLVDIPAFEGRQELSRHGYTVLLHEFKAGLNAYLATTPAAVRTRTLSDLIAFNRARPREELGVFGQDIFEKSAATAGLDDPAYRTARETSLRIAGRDGIDRMLREHVVVALIGPTVAAAAKIDAVHGDQLPGFGAGGLAAVAGTPHLTVPMGAVKGMPIGLSFIGPKWSEALLLSLGYAFEQAAGIRLTPTYRRSVEDDAMLAPLLPPAAAAKPRAP